jgi:dienelactone hydrolase
MARKIALAMLLVIVIVTSTAAADLVTFKGMSTTAAGEPLMLTAKLMKPQGDGPFPAVVMLHGCRRVFHKHYDAWAERLASWGYVALQVNSFGPRGESNICGGDRYRLVDPHTRTQDAYDAKSYLAGLPFVHRNRIAVMGWGHGGWTILYAISETTVIPKRGDPFWAAVAFYPWCTEALVGFDAPLLILIGELDDRIPMGELRNPALQCRLRMPSGKAAHEVILKVYPGVYHCFDWEGLKEDYFGHLQYDPEAAADATVYVKNFLAKHLR